ncbi:putative ABC transport system ATP-binding protein [Natranaerovirga hydrolytica]|uniref:Putative ABC transport system ATP-binding protein n=1 Tax=Natranaerovirga hydrolytica TaxID=680378 RepID=A0A4R1MPM6_9FIRM|nr:ATP-binding cassette domain-containing protein [Natranaerovirga hydrolytica]TCK93264.1 putative ABC transport system ATP-binding protein [Natranaerovirga hydrolytica]
MFRLNNVKYKHILAIETLEIGNQQTTGIVGESGSGKTTLVKLLNKMISPTSGDVFYEETPLKDLNSIEHRKEVTMLPQQPVIFEGSVKENLLFGIRFGEMPIPENSELMDLLKKVNLNKSLEDMADKMSGGEKQRLALARVLLLKPKVLLLDEPSSALDESTEDIIIRLVMDYAKILNMKVIMITHSMNIAKTYTEEIIEIKDGKVKK